LCYLGSMEENWITKTEAAALLGASLRTVDRLVAEGVIACKKYGDHPRAPVRVSRADTDLVRTRLPPDRAKHGWIRHTSAVQPDAGDQA